MSELVYIELDEQKAQTNGETGEYTVNLDKPITLNDGDQLGLFKSFIDTTVDGGEKIKLENDIQLNLSFVYYTRNWWANTATITGMKNDGIFLGDPTAPIVDNKDYLIVNPESNVPQDTVEMTTIQYIVPAKGEVVLKPKAFTANYRYVDVSGVQQTLSVKIPEGKTKKSKGDIVVEVTGLKIKCKDDSFADITAEQTLKNASMETIDPVTGARKVLRATFEYNKTPPASTDFHMTPIIEKKNVKVPKGSYDPSTLAEYITTELTRIDQVVFKGVPQGSIFLTSGTELGMSNGLDQSNNQIGAFKNSDAVAIDSETGKSVFIPVSGGRGGTTDAGSGLQYLVGASQVALTFQDNSIFTWEFLHTPYYVGASKTTKQIGIEYVQLHTAVGDYGVVNKYGGIAFSDLSANILNDDGSVGEPFDFWNDILKFDVAELCVKFESVPTFKFKDTDGTDLEGTSTKLVVPFKDSVNTTGGLVSIDETVDKTSDTVFAYTEFKGELDIATVISGTFGIQATQPFDVSTDLEFPYFRLDVECGIQNTIVGEKTLFRNVLGLIGRYYESGSFNTGTSVDALVYAHHGNPVVLSSFTVRILNSDGGTPDKLGNRNTVFLEVVKQRPSLENK